MKKWDGGFAPYPTFKPGQVALIHTDGTPGVHWASPHYTTSLDAALTLVPEGCWLSIEFAGGSREWPVVETGGGCVPRKTQARTVALALCIAALRAQG